MKGGVVRGGPDRLKGLAHKTGDTIEMGLHDTVTWRGIAVRQSGRGCWKIARARPKSPLATTKGLRGQMERTPAEIAEVGGVLGRGDADTSVLSSATALAWNRI